MSEAGRRLFVGRSDEFKDGLLTARVIDGLEVILTRVDGRIVCFKDQCAHQPVKLSEFGEMREGVLVCHAHGAGFDLRAGGRVLCGPPKDPLIGYACDEVESQVFVTIDKKR